MMVNSSLYYIMDSTGNYYRINENKELVAASNREEAELFDYKTANERIGTGKKTRFYYVITADTTSQEDEDMENVASENSIFEECKSISEYDIRNIDWLAYMQHFAFLANNATNYIDSLATQLSDVDKEMCDLLHYIELYDLSEEEMIEVTERIKDSRIRRRDIKDEYNKVDWFRKEFATNANLIKANTIIGQMKKLEHRVYRPRQVNDIFQGMKGRETDKDMYRQRNMEYVCETLINEEEENMEYVRKETQFDGKKYDWLAFARQQSEFYDNVLQYMVNLQLDMEEIEEAIEDTLVMIEDANFNVTQGYKAFKQLKDLRNEKKEKQKEYDCLRALTKGISIEEIADQAYYAVQDIEEILDVTECEKFEICEEEDRMSEAV